MRQCHSLSCTDLVWPPWRVVVDVRRLTMQGNGSSILAAPASIHSCVGLCQRMVDEVPTDTPPERMYSPVPDWM